MAMQWESASNPVLVRTCAEWIEDQCRIRHGRFIFYQGLQRDLLQRNGVYRLIVHRREKEICTLDISAQDLETRFRVSQVRQKAIPWVTIFKKLDE